MATQLLINALTGKVGTGTKMFVIRVIGSYGFGWLAGTRSLHFQLRLGATREAKTSNRIDT